MIPISNTVMKPAFVNNVKEEHFHFAIAQPSAIKWLYLLGCLMHSDFLNTIFDHHVISI